MPRARLGLRHLVAVAAGIAVTSFVVRVWFPLDTDQVAGLHLWQWPQCLALFGLGVVSARRGWLDPVPDRLRRSCGIAAVAGALLIPGFVAVAALTGVPREAFFGGWHWASLVTAIAEELLAVTVSV